MKCEMLNEQFISCFLNLSETLLTVAAISQVGPDDVLLGEAEDS